MPHQDTVMGVWAFTVSSICPCLSSIAQAVVLWSD